MQSFNLILDAGFLERSVIFVRTTVGLLSAGLCLRLFFASLHLRFPYFFALILGDLLLTIAVVIAREAMGNAWWKAFLVSLVIRWVLSLLAVLELYTKILDTHKGLASLGRKSLNILFGLATLGALAFLTVQANESLSRLNAGVMKVHGLIMATLMLFVTVVFAVLYWFPIKLSRNTKAYGIGFMVYFASKFVTAMVMQLRGVEWIPVMNVLMLLFEVACLSFWILRLSRAGELAPSAPLRKLSPSDQVELLSQLDRAERQIVRTFRQ